MIGDLLRERKGAIVQRWVEVVLATYPEDAAVLFQKERDPFANPVGHSAREGTAGLLDAILDGMDTGELRRHLDQIIRVRAVQQISPSQALSFVFSLKSILRASLPEAGQDPRLARELAEMELRVDQVGLLAFDLYSECREEVTLLRINEVKRQVAWVLEKLNRRGGGPADDPTGSDGPASMCDNEQREEPR